MSRRRPKKMEKRLFDGMVLNAVKKNQFYSMNNNIHSVQT